MELRYSALIRDSIENEKKGIEYKYSLEDRCVLDRMFEEINKKLKGKYHYLAEIDLLDLEGTGHIMAKYINQFESEGVRAYLLPQIWNELGKKSAEMIYELFLHFKTSEEYQNDSYYNNLAYIFVRYDNAFYKLKPKMLKKELFELIKNPHDAFYLPFTVRMLASWKLPKLEPLLKSYLDGSNITYKDFRYGSCNDDVNRIVRNQKRQLKFTAIDGLKHYPSVKNIELIKQYSEDPDKDIRACAKKTLKAYSKVMEIDLL